MYLIQICSSYMYYSLRVNFRQSQKIFERKRNEEECKCISILLSGIWLVFLKLKFMEILDEIVIFKINFREIFIIV